MTRIDPPPTDTETQRHKARRVHHPQQGLGPPSAVLLSRHLEVPELTWSKSASVTGQHHDVRALWRRKTPNSAWRITPLALLVVEGQALRLASEGGDVDVFK